ncbi:hypothetical protein NC652_005426 [Populus alba x Populus x berolinensis]|nr:hypothetical protein NC652_005426 [Populus alba x Populus x berolinensis]
MASLSTWCRYIAHKFEYSLSLSYKSYKGGIINNKEVYDTVWKNLFQGKLTFLHWNKGREMAPTIGDQGGTLLVRKLPTADPMAYPFCDGQHAAHYDISLLFCVKTFLQESVSYLVEES